MSEVPPFIVRVEGPTGPLPMDNQLESWLKQSGEGGRRRHHAMRTLFGHASTLFEVDAVAILGADWLLDARTREPIWQRSVGPVLAEGIGDLPDETIERILTDLQAQPELAEPSSLPRVLELPEGLWLVDLSVAGQRTAFLLLRTAQSEVARLFCTDPRASNALVLLTGLLRGDTHRVREERLAQLLAHVDPVQLAEGDRPYTAQEVVERVALVADGLISKMATLFEIGVAGLYLPDADEDFVWCLGGYHLRRHAYDAGRGDAAGLRFGLTASAAMSVAYDREGLGVVVRSIADRRGLLDRYADLGVDEEDLAADDLKRFFHPRAPEVSDGPWVSTAQRLPAELSPAGRNLVLRLQGRTCHPLWARADHHRETRRDRKRRIAAAARRVHADLVAELTAGIRRWRDGLREEVIRILGRDRAWDEACRAIAQGLSAQCVSLYEVQEDELVFRAWSKPGAGPGETFDCSSELIDARESALLRATLRPHTREIGVEGFLRWPPLIEALGRRPANTCTCPITRGGRTIGLLRVDGAMHLFGAHLRRGEGQDALVRLRPARTPHHVWKSIEELVGVLGLALGTITSDTPSLHWPSFVEEACSGALSKDEAIATLVALRAQHGSRQEAAAKLGVHRNTFRRHLARLESALGMRW